MKTIYILIAVLVIAVLGVASWFAFKDADAVAEEDLTDILSFEDCAAAGYPVMESYPRQCSTPDGRTFAEELPAKEPTYDNASNSTIRVSLPTSGAVVGKQFSVLGEARGTWFFEASFPVELRDASGTVIATGIAQAEGNWMTEDFVSFKADITVPSTFTGDAMLILKKDNPSGLPENDASVSFPITVEY